MKNWVRYNLTTDSAFFPIFQQVVNQSEGKESVIVSVINKERSAKLKTEIRDQYKLVFQYLENDVTGIDIYKLKEGI